jgi:hypothetical protein
MAWVQHDQDGEVPSLAPRGRRVMLIAAIAVPLIAIGIFVIVRDGGGGRPAKTIEPDAFVEHVDAAAAAATPDAAPPDAAIAKPIGVDAGAPASGSATTTTTVATKPVAKHVVKPHVKQLPPKKGPIKKPPPPIRR